MQRILFGVSVLFAVSCATSPAPVDYTKAIAEHRVRIIRDGPNRNAEIHEAFRTPRLILLIESSSSAAARQSRPIPRPGGGPHNNFSCDDTRLCGCSGDADCEAMFEQCQPGGLARCDWNYGSGQYDCAADC
jgi:hypothetical protein